MEGFVVSAAAASAVKRKRVTHPKERIGEAVNHARHVGAAAAAHAMNKKLALEEHVSEDTVRSWLFRFKKEGKFWEKDTKRGRAALLDAVPGIREEWARQVDGFRKQGEPVTGRLSATIVKAVLEEKAPTLLDRHGGSVKVCIKTGQNIMAEAGMSYRKKTSSRIIPPDNTVADARNKFYRDIKSCFVDRSIDLHLLLNFDQTFHQFSPTRGFTWEKKGADRVQVKESKDGFTLLPVVSAAGMVGAQMIFGGTTTASLPTVASGSQLRYMQTANHWSNEETTLALFRNIIFPHVASRRAALGDSDAPVIVLADAFSAHWTPAVLDLVATAESIAYLAVPECLTHLFQPLDLGIIAAIKQSVLRRQDEFRETEVRAAVKEHRTVMLSKSRPVLRDRITMYIKECLADPVICAAHCCRTGFERAGVLRVLGFDSAVVPDVDNIVPPCLCDECGEHAVPRADVPECVCFSHGQPPKTLCDGCFTNHDTLCPTD